MRITKHITFFNSPRLRYRYNHINRIIKEVCNYPYETDIFIHTNEDVKPHYLKKNTNGKIQVIVHDYSNGNPLYLPWSCRDLLKSQQNDYDIFIYIEDDMLITVEALQYWLQHKDHLIKHSFNLGFLRIETDIDGNEYMVDIIRKLDTNNTVVINGKNYVINNVNTFVAAWIYDRNEFKVFLGSPYYNGNGNIPNYDVQAAAGVGLHGDGMNRYKKTIIPFDDDTKQLHPGCRIYHIDNVYLYKHDECQSSTILFRDALTTKIGCVIINSHYPEREKYVKNIEDFFSNTNVIVKQTDGVFTDKVLYDARFDNIPLTKGQIGCALAHVNALKTAIDLDLDYVFIFEDDLEIIVDKYATLKSWLDKLPENDICLITHISPFVGVGHDGRVHKNTIINDIMYTTCPFGTQAYYINKKIIKLLYETQTNYMKQDKIYIADGLHIHCEKSPNNYLNIVTPIDENRFFKLAQVNSIVSA